MAEPTIENVEKRPLHDENGKFAPGNPGGPGRTPGVSLTAIIKRKMQEAPPGQIKELQELVAEVIIEEVYVKRNTHLLKELWHYMDGAPKQTVAIDADKESIDSLTALLKEAATVKKPDAEPKL